VQVRLVVGFHRGDPLVEALSVGRARKVAHTSNGTARQTVITEDTGVNIEPVRGAKYIENEGVMMSVSLSQPEPSLHAAAIGDALYVPAAAGATKWVFGDTYTIKLTSQLTKGSLGLVEASVPPGCGPVAHTHAGEDEIFYMLSGELEFLSGEQTFIAGPGDVVFIPRTVRHRFHNAGLHHVKMLFLYTPGGPENIFLEGGDEPKPGQTAQLWGPERLPGLADLMVKYGIEALPEA